MIDLTPLDVRKKAGDFRRRFRGFDPVEVETFLELAAERLEELVRENLALRERVERLEEELAGARAREEAVREAVVTAQELKRQVREQAKREAALLKEEARQELDRLRLEVERALEGRRAELRELERKRGRLLKRFRALLEQQMELLELEEARAALAEEPAPGVEGGKRLPGRGEAPPQEPAAVGEEPGPGETPSPGGGDEGAEREPLWLSSLFQEGEEEGKEG